jgi:hypothetical protein
VWGWFYRLFHRSDITDSKLEIAAALTDYLDVKEQALRHVKTIDECDTFLHQVGTVIEEYSTENRLISQRYGVSQGRLASELGLFSRHAGQQRAYLGSIMTCGQETQTSSEAHLQALRMIGRPQS